VLRLSDLIKNIPTQRTFGRLDLEITGLSQDSRTVEAGNLFFCVKGSKFDGHQYLKYAAENGAVAAVVEDLPENNWGLTIIQVKEVSGIILEVAGTFYGYPDRKLKLIGVVGTNGKTTSTYLIKSILEATGASVGLIGTITNLIKDLPLEAHNTTPGILDLQKLFARMVAEGLDYVVMEVSSHSIDQERVAGLVFECGLFTNITQDHLDYHGTFVNYLKVKTKFFINLPNTSRAVINMDDPHADSIVAQTDARVLKYGIKQPAEIRAGQVKITPSGVSYTATTPQGILDLNLKLTGDFNVYNSLGALAVGLALGIDLQSIKRGLESVAGVPGRFQLVPGSGEFGVIVDYAHTPDGLENVLETGRRLNPRRLLLVFGCGGDRDRTKRPVMGAIAAKLADFTIITSDNPRSENPVGITREIEDGFKNANPAAQYLIEVDRATAIKKIIAMAEASDLILIAGKGHENYQIFADRTIHFDDREIAREALEERFNGRIHT
jgi:UDP-N-acetylmuramoyl-L-alanyl-D-glutamate--2,6-diaminopimelate ligase